MLYYTILYYTILYYTILYYTILYYTVPHYIRLDYTILYSGMGCINLRAAWPPGHGPVSGDERGLQLGWLWILRSAGRGSEGDPVCEHRGPQFVGFILYFFLSQRDKFKLLCLPCLLLMKKLELFIPWGLENRDMLAPTLFSMYHCSQVYS